MNTAHGGSRSNSGRGLLSWNQKTMARLTQEQLDRYTALKHAATSFNAVVHESDEKKADKLSEDFMRDVDEKVQKVLEGCGLRFGNETKSGAKTHSALPNLTFDHAWNKDRARTWILEGPQKTKKRAPLSLKDDQPNFLNASTTSAPPVQAPATPQQAPSQQQQRAADARKAYLRNTRRAVDGACASELVIHECLSHNSDNPRSEQPVYSEDEYDNEPDEKNNNNAAPRLRMHSIDYESTQLYATLAKDMYEENLQDLRFPKRVVDSVKEQLTQGLSFMIQPDMIATRLVRNSNEPDPSLRNMLPCAFVFPELVAGEKDCGRCPECRSQKLNYHGFNSARLVYATMNFWSISRKLQCKMCKFEFSSNNPSYLADFSSESQPGLNVTYFRKSAFDTELLDQLLDTKPYDWSGFCSLWRKTVMRRQMQQMKAYLKQYRTFRHNNANAYYFANAFITLERLERGPCIYRVPSSSHLMHSAMLHHNMTRRPMEDKLLNAGPCISNYISNGKGVGVRFDGTYEVVKKTHALGMPGGYSVINTVQCTGGVVWGQGAAVSQFTAELQPYWKYLGERIYKAGVQVHATWSDDRRDDTLYLNSIGHYDEAAIADPPLLGLKNTALLIINDSKKMNLFAEIMLGETDPQGFGQILSTNRGAVPLGYDTEYQDTYGAKHTGVLVFTGLLEGHDFGTSTNNFIGIPRQLFTPLSDCFDKEYPLKDESSLITIVIQVASHLEKNTMLPDKLSSLLLSGVYLLVGVSVKADVSRLFNHCNPSHVARHLVQKGKKKGEPAVRGVQDLAQLAKRQGVYLLDNKGTVTRTLDALARKLLNGRLNKDKELRQCDWLRPVLEPKQLKYAALDGIASLLCYIALRLRPDPALRISPGTSAGTKVEILSSADNFVVGEGHLVDDINPNSNRGNVLVRVSLASVGRCCSSALKLPPGLIIEGIVDDKKTACSTVKEVQQFRRLFQLDHVDVYINSLYIRKQFEAIDGKYARENDNDSKMGELQAPINLAQGDVERKTRVVSRLLDVFHKVSNLLQTCGKTHTMHSRFCRMFTTAVLAWNEEDMKLAKVSWKKEGSHLYSKTYNTWDEVLHFEFQYLKKVCRRIALPPADMLKRCTDVVNSFRNCECPETKKQLLGSTNFEKEWKTFQGFINAGALSDPPDMEMYRVSHYSQRDGLTFWTCLRSTSQLENHHKEQNTRSVATMIGAPCRDMILSVVRTQTTLNAMNASNVFNSYNTMNIALLLELKDLGLDVLGMSCFPDFPDIRAIDTGKSVQHGFTELDFGINAALKAVEFKSPPGNVSRVESFIQSRLNLGNVVLAHVTTYAERKLFKTLYASYQCNFQAMATAWNTVPNLEKSGVKAKTAAMLDYYYRNVYAKAVHFRQVMVSAGANYNVILSQVQQPHMFGQANPARLLAMAPSIPNATSGNAFTPGREQQDRNASAKPVILRGNAVVVPVFVATKVANAPKPVMATLLAPPPPVSAADGKKGKKRKSPSLSVCPACQTPHYGCYCVEHDDYWAQQLDQCPKCVRRQKKQAV